MLSSFDIVLISVVILVAFLVLIYFYASRINNSSVSAKKNEENFKSKPIETGKKAKSKGKKLHPKGDVTKTLAQSSYLQEPETLSVSSSNESDSFGNEDDILALAALKGFDISSVKRRNVVTPVAVVASKSSPSAIEASIERVEVALTSTVVESSEVVISSSERLSTSITSAPFLSEATDEGIWKQVPTREEEIIKGLKQKLADSNQELDFALEKLSNATKAQERCDKKIILLQEELKEQNRQLASFKSSYEAELRALRNVNSSLSAKISGSESSSKDIDALKELSSRLQEDLRRARDTENEMARQIVDINSENEFLKEKVLHSESMISENARLQDELANAQREMAMVLEVTKAEISMNRAELESEIAFHKAEHSNATGASTALHQEISQLKSEVQTLSKSEANLKIELKQLINLNDELVSKNNDLQKSLNESVDSGIKSLSESLDQARSEISSQAQVINGKDDEIADIRKNLAASYEIIESLRFEISESNAKIESLVSEKLSLQDKVSQIEASGSKNAPNDENRESEVSALMEKLAEAEIKISSLQGDLNREIKRADVIKKVYETKIAMLTSSS